MRWLSGLLGAFFLLTILAVTLGRRDFSGAWIAYGSNNIDRRAVYLTTSDGRARRQITPFRLCAESPRWSPDGRWIALISYCAGTHNLYHVRPNGSHPQVMSTELPRVLDAQWSPDGSRLVVWSDSSDLYFIEADGVRLFASDHVFPQWSPDGEWIYARPLTNGYGDLDRIHVATGLAQRLPTMPSISRMSWSPDADQIVVNMANADRDGLFLMKPDGSTLDPIPTEGPAPELREAFWSPDGEWIAFSAGEAVAMDIYRVRPDGRDLQRLTQQSGDVWHLQWSPDGQWLLFTAAYDGLRRVYRLRADGSIMEKLTPGPGSDSAPQYAPVSGLRWHPLPTTVISLVILAASVVSSKVWGVLASFGL